MPYAYVAEGLGFRVWDLGTYNSMFLGPSSCSPEVLQMCSQNCKQKASEEEQMALLP